MKYFDMLFGAFGKIPSLVPLILVPALIVGLAVLLVFFGRRRRYLVFAGALSFLGAACIFARRGAAGGLFYLAGALALCALSSLLFFIPRPVKKVLPEKANLPAKKRVVPPKIVSEEPVRLSAEDSGIRLLHAEEVLSRLKKSRLSPSDRLEAEAISRTLKRYAGALLDERERGVLNDCLASLLKLTAKYRL